MTYMTNYNAGAGELATQLLSGIHVLVLLVWYVFCIIAWWKMFEKAGLAGWKALIPIYNLYCVYRIGYGSNKGWIFLLTLLPFIGWIFGVILQFKLAQNFGRSWLFGLGLVFLNPVFSMILGYGDSRYVGEPLL